MIESRLTGNVPKALVFVLGRRPDQVIGPSQQLAIQFATHLPVLYVMVDRLAWHVPGLRRNLTKSPWERLIPSEKLRIISQFPEPPGMSHSSSVRKLYGKLTAIRIREELARMGIGEGETAFFIYHPEPAYIVRHFPDAYWHYHCIDDFINWHSNRPGVGMLLGRLEGFLATYSDSVSATSKTLVQRMSSWHAHVSYCPNGVEVNRFVDNQQDSIAFPQDMAQISLPIFGFVGATPGYVDSDLIGYAARERPEYSFVFVGPLGLVEDKLRNFKNIHFLGAKPYECIAQYMHAFDVCLLPASRTEATVAQNTGKQHQYMATGKPIVAVDMPEIDEYRDLMYVSSNQENFVQQLDLALSDPQELKLKRIERAKTASWERRAEALLDVIYTRFGNNRPSTLVDARCSSAGL